MGLTSTHTAPYFTIMIITYKTPILSYLYSALLLNFDWVDVRDEQDQRFLGPAGPNSEPNFWGLVLQFGSVLQFGRTVRFGPAELQDRTELIKYFVSIPLNGQLFGC